MRKKLLIVSVCGAIALAAPTSASAQGGCKEFGQAVRAAAQAPGPFGQVVKQFAPVNDDFAAAKAIICAP